MQVEKNAKRVLGLDIGSNSIGFQLIDLYDDKNGIVFKDIVGNSIIFSEPDTAEERRQGRSDRRRNERKSARKKVTRKLYVAHHIADKSFIEDTTNFLNGLEIDDYDVYRLREKAVSGIALSKDEFILCTYSILTDRGYNNIFSTSNEDGVINEPVIKNEEEYIQNKYLLPSTVMVKHRTEQLEFQNFPIRNKQDDYKNSLGRDMHKEEFKKVVLSQKYNQAIFKNEAACQKFVEEILDETKVNRPFYQRPLKSFEDMVAYCTFYNEFHLDGKEKRMPLAHVKNIELTLRQQIDNYQIKNTKTGEVKSSKEMFSTDEIDKIVNFWLLEPSSNEINAKNIFKSVGYKELVLWIPEKSSQIVFNVKSHRVILKVLQKYKVDFLDKDNGFYHQLLLELHYFKNHSSRVEHINKLVEKMKVKIDDAFIEQIAGLENMDGFGSFSLRFAEEVLAVMQKGKTHHEALESLGYFSKYLDMPVYDYLPPLEPTKADIEWLSKHIPYFEAQHLFYQPMVSPKVKRVIGVLRKLVNELIQKYGKIDEIRIETAKELNTEREKKSIDENQKKDRLKNSEAKKFLESHGIKESGKNLEIAKLFKEQGRNGCQCFYSGETITKDEAFDENSTEIEHFIPRSKIWINSYKNKILVKKKYNQDKKDKHPIAYLKSIGEWENFKGRVQDSFMATNKKRWLSEEEIINSVMEQEHWEDKYLHDTRSATRVIQKYLNHYLYPSEMMYKKGEKRSVFSVSGRAIHELKYLWGIHTIMPKNEDDKKDRNTNYHHTLDAFAVALCSSSATKTLHDSFKQKENKFKTQALKMSLSITSPKSHEGVNIVEHLKQLVHKYETNALYVCPYNKRKTNMKGFKDGNLKLYVTKDKKDGSEILAEMEKVAIDHTLLVKKQGLNVKDRTDTEVKKEVLSIQSRLDTQKQQKIIDALGLYADKLLEIRSQLKSMEQDIKDVEKDLKTGVKYKEFNHTIREKSEPIKEEKKLLEKELKALRCSFATKRGQHQIVKSLKLYKMKIEKTKADVIIYHDRKEEKISRLSVPNFKQALEDKEPFVVKMNDSTLNVELVETEQRGQAVGLNYFSSIANKIETKFNDRYTDEIAADCAKSVLTLYKNDILKVNDVKNNMLTYYIFNGGGNVTGSNNKVVVKNINLRSFSKVDKHGKSKAIEVDAVSPSKRIVVSKVGIDFFGNIIEV